MKKFILISITLFLCVISGTAQNKIDKPTFEKLVDYANCKYLMSFIENNDAGKPYIKDIYERSIKIELQKATLDNLNSIPSFDKILSFFPQGQNDKALLLAKKINERKLSYDSFAANDSLLKSLSTDSWQGINLKMTADAILSEINAIFAAKDDSQSATVRSQEQKPTPETADNQQDKANHPLENNTMHFWLWLAIIVEFALIASLSAFIFFKFRDKVVNIVRNSSRIDDSITQKIIFHNQNKSQHISDLSFLEEKDIDAIVDVVTERVLECIKLEQKDDSKPFENNNVQEKSKPDVQFYRLPQNNIFTEEIVNQEVADFKIFNIKDDRANFEYCGNAVNSDLLKVVCTFENSPNAGDKITTTEKGVVKQDSNNNWEVTIPAKIKFG